MNSSARNLFDRNFAGHHFSRAIDLHERELRKLFGDHNRNCLFFRDEHDQIIGSRLLCECDTCLFIIGANAIEVGFDLIALGAGSWDVIRDGTDKCNLRQRNISVMEERVRAEREAEKQQMKEHFRAQIQVLRAEIQIMRAELQHQLRIVTGGGLTRDKDGRTWTQAQLIAMCEAQQSEDVASRKSLDAALVQALKATL